jgi:hypothetical protein
MMDARSPLTGRQYSSMGATRPGSWSYIGVTAVPVRDQIIAWSEPRPRTSPTLGHRAGMAKLDDDIVREIRRRHREGETIRALAVDVGVHYSVACSAIRGSTWKHVV